MRAAVAAAALLTALAARAGAPLALAERQVLTLEFDRPIARLAMTDPDVLALEPSGARVRLTALRGGRTAVEVAFADGATVSYDVAVEPARGRAPQAPGEIALVVGEERRVAAPGLARVLLEETGVARVRAEGDAVVVLAVAPGTASLVLVDAAGTRQTLSIRVR
ncbi:MAG TPA: pilus assembly protein N-terminal domain-containing protein [Anaeromyxobacter sp.]|nr:pilus assembly protein N-terminal domain-containing protein [Anaeromyxobacter sp.]